MQKILALIGCLVLVTTSVSGYFGKKKYTEPALQKSIACAIEHLTWESEGSDEPRVFFRKDTGGDIQDQLIAWAKRLPLTYRPGGYKNIEMQTLDELLDGVLNPEPDKEGNINDEEAKSAVRWAVLRDVLVTSLSAVEVHWLGSEISYQLVVVVGKDKNGNLAGIWFRHWSS